LEQKLVDKYFSAADAIENAVRSGSPARVRPRAVVELKR
jgi:hypothetical protein